MNIAVVDDLAVGRETLVNYLNEYFSERNMNVTISDFSDAESFVTQFENNKYNIIFFDIYMPGMSGIEAASTVRKTDSSVEIIFLSTSNNFACESHLVKQSYLSEMAIMTLKPCVMQIFLLQQG